MKEIGLAIVKDNIRALSAVALLLVGCSADDLNNIRFTARIGPGSSMPTTIYYAALALDSDGKTVWVGALFGLTKIQLSR
jgi:hypothetical protein